MNGAVLFHLVKRAEAVLNDHQRSAGIAAGQFVEGVAQAVGIDLPAPVGSLQIRVFGAAHHIALDHIHAFLNGDAVGHIIG